jgi:sulfate adenylyltransferase
VRYNSRPFKNESRTTETNLNTPYGGRLIDLLVSDQERAALQSRAAGLPRLRISQRSACDLELLATGGFSPLDRFMGQPHYERVLAEMRLADGVLFPIPITLPCDAFPGLQLDSEIALADEQNELLAVMRVAEIFPWDKEKEALLAYGTSDLRHPLVAEMNSWGKLKISGPLNVVSLPRHYDFRPLRLTPAQVRENSWGWAVQMS